MNDDNHADETPQDRIAKVALYLESVKARMPAEEFETLHQAVREMARLLADGREGFGRPATARTSRTPSRKSSSP